MTQLKAVVTVGGTPVSGAFIDNSISLAVTDRKSIRPDTLDLKFKSLITHNPPPEPVIVSAPVLTDHSIGATLVAAGDVRRGSVDCD